jgi:hypothetical protein
MPAIVVELEQAVAGKGITPAIRQLVDGDHVGITATFLDAPRGILLPAHLTPDRLPKTGEGAGEGAKLRDIASVPTIGNSAGLFRREQLFKLAIDLG